MRYKKAYDFNGIKGYEMGWSIAGPPMMTVYFYVVDHIMVDTGQSHMGKEALEIAKAQKVEQILLTHHHEDHSGNAALIKNELGVGVSGHPKTVSKMSKPYKILPYQHIMWGTTTPLDMEETPTEIETNGETLVPVHSPGHSKDHLVYHIPEKGVLFSGDLYLADRIKFFRVDEDVASQIESIKLLLSLDFDMLLCCHHPKTKQGKSHLKRKLEFLEEFFGGIKGLWEKGIQDSKTIFKELQLKEDYFTKYFCFGNVSMINGVRSVVRHLEG